MFKVEKLRFIWFILQETLLRKELVLPTKFVRESDICGSNVVTLKVDESAWQMRLSNCDGKFSLQDGWQQFTNYYSLKYGYVLHFTYEGDSKFSVLIFDNGCCEIPYPKPVTINEKSEESIIILTSEGSDDSTETQTTKSEEPNQSSSKLNGTEDSDYEFIQPQKQVKSQSSYSRPGKRRRTAGGVKIGQRRMHCPIKFMRGGRVPLSRDAKGKDLERVVDLQSSAHYFRLVIQDSYIPPRAKLQIPTSFSKRFLKDNGTVDLETAHGRSWSVGRLIIT